MDNDDGLVCAYTLAETSRALSWADLATISEPCWIHLDRGVERARQWITHEAGLPPLIAEALLADETRPRVLRDAAGTLVNLRGVNLNPGADPEDMVSLRLWVEPGRVISLRHRPLLAIRDLRDGFDAGRGMTRAGELIVSIASGLVARMGPVIEQLDEQLDELEEQLITAPESASRTSLSTVRRQAVALRRYLAPQREVIVRLATEPAVLDSDIDRARMHEIADRLTRLVEDLDALRERAAVTHEELVTRLQDRMNRNMYLLSLVAAIFLPLGFVTGLLGINVGGMPGVESEAAFWVVCLVLAVIGVAELVLLYTRRWMP